MALYYIHSKVGKISYASFYDTKKSFDNDLKAFGKSSSHKVIKSGKAAYGYKRVAIR